MCQDLITLEAKMSQVELMGTARVTISPYGATVRSFTFPMPEGDRDLLLGPAFEQEWKDQDKYFNATIGRVANRLGGATFTLDGKQYHVAQNNGPNSLHGGADGLDQKVFHVIEKGSDHVHLRWISNDGESGYPGTLTCDVHYRLTGGEEVVLNIDYEATTDATTLCNLTWHGYWNIDGITAGSLEGQSLIIDAEQFTALDHNSCPTGEILSVAGTGLDFRKRRMITEALEMDCPHIRQGRGLDHNYILHEKSVGQCRRVATLWGRDLTLSIETTQPGMQVYTANYLDGDLGKMVETKRLYYPARSGICFETQAWPDAIHHSNFPSIVLRPNERYRQQTRYIVTTI